MENRERWHQERHKYDVDILQTQLDQERRNHLNLQIYLEKTHDETQKQIQYLKREDEQRLEELRTKLEQSSINIVTAPENSDQNEQLKRDLEEKESIIEMLNEEKTEAKETMRDLNKKLAEL